MDNAYIGLNIFAYWLVPLTNTTEDKIATQRANDFFVSWIVHPLMFGQYPEAMRKNAGSRIPAFTYSESKQVKGSFDFLGINFYAAASVKDNPSGLEKEIRDFNADMAAKIRAFRDNTSASEHPVTPWALQGLLEYFKQVYGNPPIYIHENGLGTRRNSSLEDWPRVKALHGYTGGVLDAVRNGSNTRGYFTWSFLDVFEMMDGYESGYGLYYVDLDDPFLKRQAKLSAHWYSKFLIGKSLNSDETTKLQNMKMKTLDLHAQGFYSH